jgi:FAD/FMN-containing dehydrogenase
MPEQLISSWGNVIRARHPLLRLRSRFDSFPDLPPAQSILPYGNGRSYGDSCLNVGGALLETRSLDHFIKFDPETGVLACEAGTLLADILQLVVPHGWFPPVTPGTRFVTVGGAIANDVHGKNHHRAGTFSQSVRCLELLRSDGQRLACSKDQHPEWFAATVGGLGLTGLITWAELQLQPIAGPYMDVETIRFRNLDEFLTLCAESDRDFEYTVSWIDCLSRGQQLGRGVFQRANHTTTPPGMPSKWTPRQLTVPLAPPFSLINNMTLHVFNTLYYHRQLGKRTRNVQHYESFFYPLDGIRRWNRLYGPHGLHQYQCVVPREGGRDAIAALLEAIAASGQGSFLAVLKVFGNRPSLGLLSFPQEGITLALDFPNRGDPLEQLFRRLDSIVIKAGGRLYPAKDGRMPGAMFRSGYPRWSQFAHFIDPRSSSNFWRRVTETA